MEKDQEFPVYKKGNKRLYAFISNKEMYKIEMIGSNKNEGCTIDHYTTRKMVLKHWNGADEVISEFAFEYLYGKFFHVIKNKILNR